MMHRDDAMNLTSLASPPSGEVDVGDTDTNHSFSSTRPTQCLYLPKEKVFRVLNSRGKTLAAGGFGYMQLDRERTTSEESAINQANKPASQFLYLEEVIYLRERGVLDAYSCISNTGELDQLLSLQELYQLFTICQIPIAAYLVYQHVRAQTFRIVRHTERRTAILQEMSERYKSLSIGAKSNIKELLNDERIDDSQNDHTNDEPLNTDEKVMKRKRAPWRTDKALASLSRMLRQASAQTAKSIPTMIFDHSAPSTVAFDCYNPNGSFSPAYPGIPDFMVAVTYFDANVGDRGPSFSDLQGLLQNASQLNGDSPPDASAVSLKIATVSDSGTVVMLGVTDFGVPTILSQSQPLIE